MTVTQNNSLEPIAYAPAQLGRQAYEANGNEVKKRANIEFAHD